MAHSSMPAYSIDACQSCSQLWDVGAAGTACAALAGGAALPPAAHREAAAPAPRAPATRARCRPCGCSSPGVCPNMLGLHTSRMKCFDVLRANLPCLDRDASCSCTWGCCKDAQRVHGLLGRDVCVVDSSSAAAAAADLTGRLCCPQAPPSTLPPNGLQLPNIRAADLPTWEAGTSLPA